MEIGGLLNDDAGGAEWGWSDVEEEDDTGSVITLGGGEDIASESESESPATADPLHRPTRTAGLIHYW
ncbi:hypothetical protein GN244_ATG21039 [Phytophthora infestans]|uniref:Uncharacterized protein n=1 Tax=Phytophthora infestans TaxID=4787 RepID=A0A833SHX4_PHYIN|nr:hypothetical protein GN244_ATG21039 [Phytophthora infestans]